jgi:hypothetical protein
MGRKPRISVSEEMRKPMDDVGAHPLAGSGFEEEAPENSEAYSIDRPAISAS